MTKKLIGAFINNFQNESNIIGSFIRLNMNIIVMNNVSRETLVVLVRNYVILLKIIEKINTFGL